MSVRTSRSLDVIKDIDFMRSAGETDAEAIAARLGMNLSTVASLCYHVERNDLAAIFATAATRHYKLRTVTT